MARIVIIGERDDIAIIRSNEIDFAAGVREELDNIFCRARGAERWLEARIARVARTNARFGKPTNEEEVFRGIRAAATWYVMAKGSPEADVVTKYFRYLDTGHGATEAEIALGEYITNQIIHNF